MMVYDIACNYGTNKRGTAGKRERINVASELIDKGRLARKED
jgi:hypothetical protein